MDEINFNLLKYFLDTGTVDLNNLTFRFQYDYNENQISTSLNYLIGKKYIISNGDLLSVSYILSHSGRQIVVDTINQRKLENEKQTLKERLEVENLKLQNESIKYQNTLRNMQYEINSLTANNLKLQNKQLKRYILYSILGFFFGAALTNYKELFTIINKILH